MSRPADLCGIALVLADGTVHASAQADQPFSVQSAVKPFLFALALLDSQGQALDRVGIEPTGESFDASSSRPAPAARRTPWSTPARC